MAAKPSVLVLLPLLVSCADTVAPAPEPLLFAYQVSVTGSLNSSFFGLTQALTLDDAYAKPLTPSGPMSATDATDFGMIPDGETVGLSVKLLGPFEAGAYELLTEDEAIDPTAKRFEVVYSARTSRDTFHHYRVTRGTVTVTVIGQSRRVSLSLAADSAEVVRHGNFAEVVSSPVQLTASLIEYPWR